MLNQAIMMGRLCADPELRKTQSEISVCSIRIAVDRDYGKGEQKETDFFDVVAWRGTAEFICVRLVHSPCKSYSLPDHVAQKIGLQGGALSAHMRKCSHFVK